MNVPLILARAVHYGSTLMVAGVVIFIVLIARPAFRTWPIDLRFPANLRRRLAGIVWVSFVLWLMSGAAWLVFTAASMSGRPPAQVFSQNVLWTVLSQTDFGNDWLIRFVIACCLAGLLVRLLAARSTGSFIAKAMAVAFAAALAGSLAFAGHAIGGEGIEGIVHPTADFFHLIAAAAWVGALVPLAILLSLTGTDGRALAAARRATTRFSTLGIACVAALLITGLVNSWYLVGSVSALNESEYGRLLLIKLSLFAAMVAVAVFNWSRLTPTLLQDGDVAAAQRARRGLRRNAAIEAGVGTLIIGIVAVLGTLPPASHAHHEAASGPIPADASFQHIHGEDGMADVLIEPGHVGTANARVHLLDNDLETLAAKRLTLTLTAPSPGSESTTRPAAQDSEGIWHVDGVKLAVAGAWTVSVTATLTSNKRLELTAPIEIDPR